MNTNRAVGASPASSRSSDPAAAISAADNGSSGCADGLVAAAVLVGLSETAVMLGLLLWLGWSAGGVLGGVHLDGVELGSVDLGEGEMSEVGVPRRRPGAHHD